MMMEEIINKIFSKHNTTALKVKPYAPLTKGKMTLPFEVKSITIENTGFNSDGETVKIISIDEDMCELEEPVECIYDAGGYTMGVCNTEFRWSFTKLKDWDNPYVLIQLK